mgnify:CR=1 FL=1
MENELKTDLSNYKPEVYAKPSVTVDNIILQLVEGKFKVLLIKRKKPPFQNCWAFPGGFLDVDTNNNPDPSLEYAALRELKEETGDISICADSTGKFFKFNVGHFSQDEIDTVIYELAQGEEKGELS